MSTNVTFNAVLENNLPNDGLATIGAIYITDSGKIKVGDSSSNLLDISSLRIVDTLPITPVTEIGYILTTDNSLNYYTNQWNKINSSNQIIIDTVQPSDTDKLWLDITDLSTPRLKYYNGTSWVNGSTSINDLGELGDTSEVFSCNKVLILTNDLRSDIGDITSLETTNTTSLTVACNELLDRILTSNTATNISFDGTTTGMSDTNVQSAIDSLFTFANDGKILISSVIGSPSTSTETFSQLRDDITAQKVVLANTLTDKGIDSTSSESINSLVSKVAQINVGGGNVDQLELDVTAPYTHTYTFTNPINIKNLCQTLIYYTNGELGVSKYTCGFDSEDSSDFILGDNITFDGTMDLDTKTQISAFTDSVDLDNGTMWTSVPLDSSSFYTIDVLTCTCDDIPYLQIDGTNFPTLTLQNSDIDLSDIKKIDGITWTNNLSDSGVALLIVSFDVGATWLSYYNDSWTIVDTADLSDVLEKGMDINTVTNLTSYVLETARSNNTTMRLGYYLEKGNFYDTANNDSITLTVDLMGIYDICPNDYYTITFDSDGSYVQYDFTTSGNYVLNIEDNI